MKEEPNLHIRSVGWFDGVIRHDTLHNPLDLAESDLIELVLTIQ